MSFLDTEAAALQRSLYDGASFMFDKEADALGFNNSLVGSKKVDSNLQLILKSQTQSKIAAKDEIEKEDIQNEVKELRDDTDLDPSGPKSVPAENLFLLSPALQDQKNVEKIKEMMERGDEDFANEIQVSGNQLDIPGTGSLEVDTGDDWHQTFLAKHDRLSFAQQRGLQASQNIGQSEIPCVEEIPPEKEAVVNNLKKSNLSLMQSAVAVDKETEMEKQRKNREIEQKLMIANNKKSSD